MALSCVERGQPSFNDPDAGSVDANGTGGDDAGSGMGSSGSGNGSSGTANGSGGMDGGSGVDHEVDGGDAGGSKDPPPPVCGANPVVGCVVNTQDAVFVSAGVAASGDGSQDSPVKTIGEGIELARSQEATRIVVCNGVYEEQVSLTVDDSGRSLSGGYNCDSWLYNPDGETLVRPTERGYALHVIDTTQRVTIANFTFDALAGVDPGESSIAAFITNASDVRLKRVVLLAHDGVAGETDSAAAYTPGNEWPADNDLDGSESGGHVYSDEIGRPDVGGPEVTVMCPGSEESTTGGRGGDHPYLGSSAINGAPGLPVDKGGSGGMSSMPQTVASGCDTVGSGNRCNCVPIVGRHGAAGDSGEDGAGATEVGAVSSDSGWVAFPGLSGGVGHPGGGGGGGDGAWQNSSGTSYFGGWVGGGSGGAGGCGGAGGPGGTAGGSSIALLALDSAVTLEGCNLVTASGRAGGAGAGGQAGQQGGNGGDAPSVVIGEINSYPCAGGDGGQGGTGGDGGGGAGGVSVGVAWAGDFEPAVDTDTVITLGDPGAAGVGGDPGNNDGIAGVSQEVLEVPAG